jgi:hypothetical protein
MPTDAAQLQTGASRRMVRTHSAIVAAHRKMTGGCSLIQRGIVSRPDFFCEEVVAEDLLSILTVNTRRTAFEKLLQAIRLRNLRQTLARWTGH